MKNNTDAYLYGLNAATTGKVPPQAVDLEQAVLGACLLDKNAIALVSAVLTPDCFYTNAHQKIFGAIVNLLQRHEPVDLLTMQEEMLKNNSLDEVGGALYLSQLTMKVGSAAHVEHHARIIYEKHVRREFIGISAQLSRLSFNNGEGIEDIASMVQNNIFKLLKLDTNSVQSLSDAIDDVYKTIDFNLSNNGGLVGIGTGIEKYDKFTGGLQAGDLLVIAGETSQGKTSLAVSMVNNAAVHYKAKVAFYSLEMTGRQLASRIIAQVTDVSSKDILYKKLSNDECTRLDKGVGIVHKAQIYFDDKSTSSIDDILRSIQMMKIKYDIDIFVVDYIQLVKTKSRATPEQQLGDIARDFKNIAKELKITGIVLSQLNRNPDNPRPTLGRLRGSGQIEEAADQVIFTYRPQYYNDKYGKGYEYPEGLNRYPVKNTAMIDIAKGRNTGTYSFVCSFDAQHTHFYNLDEINIRYKEKTEPF